MITDADLAKRTATQDPETPEGDPGPWQAPNLTADPPPALAAPVQNPPSDGRVSSLPLFLSAMALAATLTAPYWSPPLYRALRLQPAGLEWQARQEVETGRLAGSVAELDRKISDLTLTLAKTVDQGRTADAVFADADARFRVVTLLQLRATLRRPIPFDVELKAVRALGGKLDELEPLLSALEAYAANGIPVESQLRQDFAMVADAFGRADPRPLPVKWLSSVTGWPAVAVEPESLRPMAAAEQAQALLADGNLPAAVDRLAVLELAPTGPAHAWMEDATARIAANQAIDRIAGMAVAAIGRLTPKS